MKKLLFVLIVLSASLCVQAQVITIAIEAAVSEVDDPANFLEGAIAVDDIITGTYTYNTDTPDTNPSSTVGDYWHYESPYGIDLLCNGLEFKTDLTDIDFLMEIANNHDVAGGFDKYGLISYNNLPLSLGIPVEYIEWALIDYSELATSDTALPFLPPDIASWGTNLLIIQSQQDNYYKVEGFVTSAILVPEPMTMLFLGAGILFIRREET